MLSAAHLFMPVLRSQHQRCESLILLLLKIPPILEQCADAQIVTVLRREDQGGESLRSLLLQIRFRLDQCPGNLHEMV